MKRWLLTHLSIWWLAAVPLCGCSCELWIMLHRAQRPAERVGAAMDWWFDCRRNPACLTSKVQGTMGAMTASAGQSVLASREIVATLKDVHPKTNAVLDETASAMRETKAAIAETRETIRETTALVHSMRADVEELAKSSNELVQSATQTLQPLRNSLDQIDQLSRELVHQVDAISPAALDTVQHLDQAVQDLDKLLADPDIQATLAHVSGTAGHLEGSAESIDIALRPWREKANMLKTVVSKALGLIKITLPLF
jgi:chromosome segregation ATPase